MVEPPVIRFKKSLALSSVNISFVLFRINVPAGLIHSTQPNAFAKKIKKA
jgi:hypothetical protein